MTAAAPVKARCVHFGTCGGCSLQDRSYDDQLLWKRDKVNAALASAGAPALAAVRPSPQAWHYRNKMEFSFGDVFPPAPSPWLKLGLKPKGRWHTILDLSECWLPSPETPALLESVRRWAEREKVPPYNAHKKEGVLRHLVLREAKNRPERMVTLVTTTGEVPRESFVEAVRSAYPATSILLGANAKASDTAVSDALTPLLGQPFVTETLLFPDGGSLDYRISPHSFFQTNTAGAGVLYGLLRDWTRELGAALVLDLYCGGGGIALSLAGACGRVLGVESNPAAVADARANAERNGLTNAEFFGGQVEFLLPSLLDMKPGVAVVDPPRAGLHASAVRALLASPPPRLFYVSCNPEALGRDLAALAPLYAVERLDAVDLFPHTEHVEAVAALVRR